MDFRVERNEHCSDSLSLITLHTDVKLPEIKSGQFVNILPPPQSGVLLRRPISICDVDYKSNLLTILVKNLGRVSADICKSQPGDVLNLLLPLGNGFSMLEAGQRGMLIGGGVGIAPLLYLSKQLADCGCYSQILLGGRSDKDIPKALIEAFNAIGDVHITTDDGSRGMRGVVTQHPVMSDEYDKIYCCGPLVMMKAVAAIARGRGIECEVSLENKMACGVGACLCCVEPTHQGNKCTCTYGPVFNIKELKW